MSSRSGAAGRAQVPIEGVAPRTTTGRVRLLSLAMLIGPVLATALLLSLSVGNARTRDRSAEGAGIRLDLVRSGLLTDEPLSRPETGRTFEDRFELDPLAPQNGVVFSEVGRHGLDVGVNDHAGWEGYFAMTHDFYPAGSVFHTAMEALPPVLTGDGIGEAVFAVQTGSTKITSDVNFVTVNTWTSKGRLKWQVGYSEGTYSDAKRTGLGEIADPPAALVPDHPVGVTVRTDGSRRLSVYLDDTEVLNASDLHMNMEPPLQAYLEVQARDVAYTSRFTDFWVTSSDTLTIEGLPRGTEVRLGEAGSPLATATADAGGRVELRLPLPRAHGRAPLSVRLSDGTGWQTLDEAFTYSGGDLYRAETGRTS